MIVMGSADAAAALANTTAIVIPARVHAFIPASSARQNACRTTVAVPQDLPGPDDLLAEGQKSGLPADGTGATKCSRRGAQSGVDRVRSRDVDTSSIHGRRSQ